MVAPNLNLPFKPFTADEILQITGVSPEVLDSWITEGGSNHGLPLQRGENAVGLNWMQTFAVFVGWTWLNEGYPPDRTAGIVEYIGWMEEAALLRCFKDGLVWPVPKCMEPAMPGRGMMVKEPKLRRSVSINVKRLKINNLWDEFQARTAYVFNERVQPIRLVDIDPSADKN